MRGYGVPGLTVTSGPFNVLPRTFLSRRTHSARRQARTSVYVPFLLTSFHKSFQKSHSAKSPREFTTPSTSSFGIFVATTKQYRPLVQLKNCTRSLSIRVHFCPQILVELVSRPDAATPNLLGCWNMQNFFPWPAKVKPTPSARGVRYRTTLSSTMPSGSQRGY